MGIVVAFHPKLYYYKGMTSLAISLIKKRKNTIKIIALVIMASAVTSITFINLQEKSKINESRLPEKVATSRYFNRWITNLKNKEIEIEGKEFSLVEEREALNMSVLKVYSLDDPEKKAQLEQTLADLQNTSHVAFAPNNRLILDYRDQIKEEFGPNQVRLFGQKESKIIEAQIIDCYTPHNCYFDRAYFLTNDFFVIHEFSLANRNDTCTREETCKHTFKTHLVDLISNKVRTYASDVKDFNIEAWVLSN